MRTVMRRNVEVGAGAPKVIVPIVGKTREEIVAKGRELAGIPLHVVEWRVDFYDDVFDTEKVLETLRQLREALGDTPILFTFRTKKEGGEKSIDPDAYTALNTAVAQSGNADAIDVEIFSGDEVVKGNIDAIHAAGKVVIGSNHDFDKTPTQAVPAAAFALSLRRKGQGAFTSVPAVPRARNWRLRSTASTRISAFPSGRRMRKELPEVWRKPTLS